MVWYRGHRPPQEPNLTFLQNALDQTQGQGVICADQWRALLLEKLAPLDPARLRADVEPFLEHPDDARLLSAGNLRIVLAE